MKVSRGLLDGILLQAGWWVAVLGAANGLPWAGPAGVALLTVGHCAPRTPAERRLLLRRGLGLAVLGTALDSLLARSGVLGFTDAPIVGLAPPWITALWFQFAVAPDILGSLRSRWALAALLGAVGGPLAYAGGARLGAASLGPVVGEPAALLVLGLVWAGVFPLLLALHPAAPSTTPEAHPA